MQAQASTRQVGASGGPGDGDSGGQNFRGTDSASRGRARTQRPPGAGAPGGEDQGQGGGTRDRDQGPQQTPAPWDFTYGRLLCLMFKLTCFPAIPLNSDFLPGPPSSSKHWHSRGTPSGDRDSCLGPPGTVAAAGDERRGLVFVMRSRLLTVGRGLHVLGGTTGPGAAPCDSQFGKTRKQPECVRTVPTASRGKRSRFVSEFWGASVFGSIGGSSKCRSGSDPDPHPARRGGGRAGGSAAGRYCRSST